MEEQGKLRKAGLATAVEIGDKVYTSRSVISTAGTTASASMRADRIVSTMAAFERQLETDPQVFRDFLKRNGIGGDRPIDLEFAIFTLGSGVAEKNSQTPIRLG